jgi:DNA-binding NarL/FixJ family response regulator
VRIASTTVDALQRTVRKALIQVPECGVTNASPPTDSQRLITEGIMNTKIVIIDHHLLFSEVLRVCLEQHGMTVLACLRTGEEGIPACRQLQPDVVLISLDLPDADGIRVGQKVLEHCADARLFLVTEYGTVTAARHATRAGFRAYLTKATTSLAQFVHVIETAMNGNDRIHLGSRQVPRKSTPIGDRDVALLVNQLTPREFTVLHLLSRGMGSRDIAAEMRVRPNTVRTHVHGILTKLQVHSRLEAVAFAVRHGIVEGNPYLDAM